MPAPGASWKLKVPSNAVVASGSPTGAPPSIDRVIEIVFASTEAPPDSPRVPVSVTVASGNAVAGPSNVSVDWVIAQRAFPPASWIAPISPSLKARP